MALVRSFAVADIPAVARLHRTVFPAGDGVPPRSDEAYRVYLTDVFLNCPSRDPQLPSLVYQEDNGRIVGFIGVVPRQLSMGRRHFQAAISSQFVVDPTSAVAVVAIRLARQFLQGPQDLSISDEANDTSKRIWEALGGTTALLHSLHWTRPLRPAQFALSLMRRRRKLAMLAAAASPLAPVCDAIATKMPQSQLYQSKPVVSAVDELTEQAVLAYLPEFVSAGSLHVEYDEPTLRWVLARARQRRAADGFRAAVIRNGQRTIGWYVYHIDSSRTANVLQVVADPTAIGEVLDHMFFEAAGQGALAATGRLDPAFLQALSDKYCVLHRRGPWVLLSSRRAELLHSFQSGDAVFSRLDGEWALGL